MEQSLRSNSFREKLLFPLLLSFSNAPPPPSSPPNPLPSFFLFLAIAFVSTESFALPFALPRHVRLSLSLSLSLSPSPSIPWPGRSVKPRTRIVSSSIARLMKCERRYNVSPTFLAFPRFLSFPPSILSRPSLRLFFLLSHFFDTDFEFVSLISKFETETVSKYVSTIHWMRSISLESFFN